MINVYVKSGEAINLGREGTKGVRRVIFDFTRWAREYGEGSVQLVVMRHGDTSPYPVALTVDGEEAVWEVGAADTAIPGEGECEWQYFVGDALEKSEVYKTFVENAMGEAANEAPEAAQGWVEQVLEAAAKVETAIKKAPIIFADTWWIWDADAEEYVDTGVNAKGKNGESITIANITESEASGGANIVTFSDGKTLTVKNGKDGEDGYTPVKGKDYFDGKDGYTPQKGVDYFDGKDGKTPVKGEDYFTAEDKAEIVERVIEEMPEQSGGIEITNTAAVGQTVKITAIDADGKPTEWEAVDFPEGGAAIVDVVELPTEDIDEDVFYRVMTATWVYEGAALNNYVCYAVNSLPEVGEPVTDTSMSYIKAYYNTQDGVAYGYLDNTLSAVLGFPVGWYDMGTLLTGVGESYGGVIYDSADSVGKAAMFVLLEYDVYQYKETWTALKVIGWAGTGYGAEVFNTKANVASAPHTHAEGCGTTASGGCSHAEGEDTVASHYSCHAEGYGTTASNRYSHAQGLGTTASGHVSHAQGYYTIAASESQHAQGKYNIEDTADKYAHIVGNGTSDTVRSNAHTLDWDGVGWYAGGLKVGGTGQDDAEAQDVMLAPLTAKAGQTIVVKEVDENGKPLSWEPVDNVTSWNDLTDKPFYVKEGEQELVSENEFTYENGAFAGQVVAVPAADETYTVTYNGAEFNLTAISYETRILFGNLSAMGIGEDTGEPFMAMIDPETCLLMVAALDNAQELKFSIKGKVKEVKKLDEIFYNAPCVFYLGTSQIINGKEKFYIYMDADLTIRATADDLRAANKKNIILKDGNASLYPMVVNFYPELCEVYAASISESSSGYSLNVIYCST